MKVIEFIKAKWLILLSLLATVCLFIICLSLRKDILSLENKTYALSEKVYDIERDLSSVKESIDILELKIDQ